MSLYSIEEVCGDCANAKKCECGRVLGCEAGKAPDWVRGACEFKKEFACEH